MWHRAIDPQIHILLSDILVCCITFHFNLLFTPFEAQMYSTEYFFMIIQQLGEGGFEPQTQLLKTPEAVLVKACLCKKCKAPRLQRFLTLKQGAFKEACFKHTFFLCLFNKLKASFIVLFLIFQKNKPNLNCRHRILTLLIYTIDLVYKIQ